MSLRDEVIVKQQEEIKSLKEELQVVTLRDKLNFEAAELANKRIDGLQDDIKLWKQANDSAVETIQEKQQRIDEWQSENKFYVNEVEIKNQRIEELIKSYSHLKISLDESNEINISLQSSLKEKEKECDGLKGLCILKDAKIDSQQEKLEELKAENERLNKELNYFHDKGEINP
jgi:chromosome segregation ATPase